MKLLKRLWAALRGNEDGVTPQDVNIAYQLGVKTGTPIGEGIGRAAAVSELEALLLSRHQFDQNFTLDDLKTVKVRSIH